jgi:glutaredoxin
MRRRRVRERTFKRVSFATTIGGVLLMAIGLQAALVAGDAILAGALLVAGAALALTSVFLEPAAEAGFTVTLYTREGCTLCDAARAFLVGKKAEYDYDLWEVDVDHDKAAGAKYSDWVPVATVKDEELFRLAPDWPRLEGRLRELADARVRR